MKKLLIVPLSILALATSSHAASYVLSGSMDVLQAGTNGGFGVGTGNGNGTIAGNYDDATNVLSYLVTWDDLTSAVTNMHFHLGAPGASGGVAVAIPGPWSSPESGSTTLSGANETALLAGDLYVNVHTANFGGGEIRGQVVATAVPEPGASVLALGALGAFLLRRRRI